MYYLHPLVCALNARVQVSAKTRGGGTRGRGHRRNHPYLPSSFPHHPGRARYFRASQASLWHISLASLCLFRPPSLFHPLQPGSPTAKRARRRWLESKRICGERWKGEGGSDGTSGSRPGRHSRNDFVLRACLIMNPHPGEAPPPFARTTTSSSNPRGSSRGGGR